MPNVKQLSLPMLVAILLAACTSNNKNENRIIAENQLPGTTDWLINVKPDSCGPPNHRYCRRPQIEGYSSKTSYSGGDTVDLFVSTEPNAQFTIDIYRMGYYQGKGGHLKKSAGPLQGMKQAEP